MRLTWATRRRLASSRRKPCSRNWQPQWQRPGKKGFSEGEAQANRAAAPGSGAGTAAIAAAVTEFARQRTDYFRRVESEAVRLALSIARKVLHREAQMDPLLLAGRGSGRP